MVDQNRMTYCKTGLDSKLVQRPLLFLHVSTCFQRGFLFSNYGKFTHFSLNSSFLMKSDSARESTVRSSLCSLFSPTTPNSVFRVEKSSVLHRRISISPAGAERLGRFPAWSFQLLPACLARWMNSWLPFFCLSLRRFLYSLPYRSFWRKSVRGGESMGGGRGPEIAEQGPVVVFLVRSRQMPSTFSDTFQPPFSPSRKRKQVR